MRPDLLRERQLLLGDVDGDDPGCGEVAQQLDTHMPEPAGPDDDGGGAADQLRQRRLDRVIGSQSGVGKCYRSYRIEVTERHQVPGVVDEQVLGHRTVGAESGRGDGLFGRVEAVVLLTLRAAVAGAAAPRPVHRHRCSLGHRLHAGPDRGDHPDTSWPSVIGSG